MHLPFISPPSAQMSAPAVPSVIVERRKPRQKNLPKDYGWTLYLIIITLLIIAGFFISHDHLYKPGDKVGYNIGLAGGLMMLTLLAYPLRKRMSFMKTWGLIPSWFKWHMIFGILGPTLILYHTTFHIGSINAGVALLCMMLVSGSGIFGRFFYTKIHYGLYGRNASYKQLQEDLDGAGDMKSIFSFAPHIQQKLIEFRDRSIGSTASENVSIWKFLTIGFRRRQYSKTLITDLRAVMLADGKTKKWSPAQIKSLIGIYTQNKTFIQNYLKMVQDIAQFKTYERLFSLWHIFHVPLVFMLVFSAIWHVISVHKY